MRHSFDTCVCELINNPCSSLTSCFCSQRDRADVYVFSEERSPALFVDDYFIDINNVGSMSQCLYAYNNPNYDDVVGSGWQAAQVSTISIMNFLGRLLIGKYYSHSFYPCTLV